MVEVYLALGSNVGDKVAFIESAKKLLSKKIFDLRSAKFYNSKAVGYTNQADFTNTAICGNTILTPNELLKFIKNTEFNVGRTKSFRWGPREIDIDIIFYGDLMLSKEDLTIPHPRFAERDFVLLPLSELNPNILDPISGQKVSQILQKLPNSKYSIY